METIRIWCTVLCFAAAGCSALQILAPKGSTGKVFRLITLSFFICCLLFPILKLPSLSDLDVDFLPETIVQQKLDQKVNEQLQEQIREAVTGIAGEALNNSGITAEKIEVLTDTSENGGIYIHQVILYVDKQSMPQATTVREVLEKRLDTEVLLKRTS